MIATLPYRNVYAFGFGNIFTDTWVEAPAWEGRQLVEGAYMRGVNYWHVQIVPVAEIYIPAEELEAILALPLRERDAALKARLAPNAVDGVSELNGQSRKYDSMLKVRLRWGDGNGYRVIDFDLGAGVDVYLPPSANILGELLVPAPPSAPGTQIAVPSVVTERPIGFITSVQCRFDCLSGVADMRKNAVRYTDTRFLTDAVPTAFITRHRSTHRISAVATSAIGTLRMLHDRNPPLADPSFDLFGRLEIGSYSASPTGGNQIRVSDIPGATNLIRYSKPAEGTQTVSVIQELTF
jgi:hypothetical protein